MLSLLLFIVFKVLSNLLSHIYYYSYLIRRQRAYTFATSSLSSYRIIFHHCPCRALLLLYLFWSDFDNGCSCCNNHGVVPVSSNQKLLLLFNYLTSEEGIIIIASYRYYYQCSICSCHAWVVTIMAVTAKWSGTAWPLWWETHIPSPYLYHH